VAGRVAFPAFCLIQDDDAELGRAYRNFIEYIGKVVLPVAACAAVAAPELIGTVYGHKWLPAAQPLRLLSVGLGLLGLRTGIGSVYFAKGHPEIDIYLHGARLLLIVGAIYALSSFGLAGISAGMSAVEGLISIAGLLVALSLVKLRPGDLVKAAMPGFRLAVACAFAAAAGKVLGILCGVTGPLALVLIALPPGVVFLWLESQTITSMVAGALDINKITGTQLSGS
jgi:lipopolysaccharide exporter